MRRAGRVNKDRKNSNKLKRLHNQIKKHDERKKKKMRIHRSYQLLETH